MTDHLLGTADDFKRIRMPDAEVYYMHKMGIDQMSDAVMNRLILEASWRHDEIVVWGRRRAQPRLTAWYGDPGCHYTYSGITMSPLPWTEVLREVKTGVEAATGSAFNSVLLNCYRDHRDSMGFHSDDEPELGPRPVIASLSLGAERVFVMKHKTRRDVQPVRLRLASGSLLLMKGETQCHWRHGIPKQARPCGPRVNLTFRRILS
jgi:alkylated DNA repair dioxygenase AlkB